MDNNEKEKKDSDDHFRKRIKLVRGNGENLDISAVSDYVKIDDENQETTDEQAVLVPNSSN